MRVFAVDPGNYFGFALTVDGELAYSGVWHLKGEAHEPVGRRFHRLFHRLADIAEAGVPDVVAIETKFALPGSSTRNLLNTGGYLAVLHTWCVEHQISTVRELAPSSLKKRATGHGRADKADMAAWASHRSGQDIRDDNQADAVCLAFVIHEELTGA